MISAFAIKNKDVVNVGVYLNSDKEGVYRNNVEGIFNKMISKEGVISLVDGDVLCTNCIIYNNDLYKDIPTEGLNKEYLVTKIVPRIRGIFKNHEKIDASGCVVISIIVIHKDKMFLINAGANVIEIEDCMFFGDTNAIGSFVYQCDKIEEKDKVKVFNKLASDYLVNKSSPLMVTDSKELDFKEWRE